MHVGNKLFPYPVLNKNKELSDYVLNCSFGFVFETSDDAYPIIEDEALVLKDACFILSCDVLEKAIQIDKVSAAIVVECSKTVFRKTFPISQIQSDIEIPISDLSGAVSVSCYLYAKEAFQLPESESYLSDYAGLSFNVERYDLLAVDDGFTFRVDLDENEDNQVSSIFSIVQVESKEDLMRYQNTEQRIIIQLPHTYYSSYDNIKMNARFNNISFSILAIPALCGCLGELQDNDYEDIFEIIDNKQWFRSVLLAYEREQGTPLDYETFKSTNALELAQVVLNGASCKGLHDFEDILLNGNNNEDGDYEQD